MKRIFFFTAMVFGLMAATQVQAAGYCPVGSNCGLSQNPYYNASRSTSNWQAASPRYNNFSYGMNGYRYSSNNWSSFNGNTGIVPRGNCVGGNCVGGNCGSGNCSTGRCSSGNCGTSCPNGNCNGTQYKGAYVPYYPNRSVSLYNTPYYNNTWNLPRTYYRPLGY